MSDDEESFHSADEGDLNDDQDQLLTARSTTNNTVDCSSSCDTIEHGKIDVKQWPLISEKLKNPIVVIEEQQLLAEVNDCNLKKEERQLELNLVKNVLATEPDQLTDEAEPLTHVSDDDNEVETAASGWDVDDWEDDFDQSDLVTPEEELNPYDKLSLLRDISPEDLTPEQEVRPSISTRHKYTCKERASSAERPAHLWDWNNLWSAATDSLSNLTSTVGEGFTTVLETVETGLGAPTPADLARLTVEERLELNRKVDLVKEPWPQGDKDDCDSAAEEGMSEGGSDAGEVKSDEASSGYQSDGARSRDVDPSAALTSLVGQPSTLTGFFSGVTNTGKTLVTGSLDVLETLGKKTYETLTVTETEGEKQRRRFILSQQKPNLSNVLRELKVKGEHEAKSKQEEEESRRSNYAFLFDRYEGMVHLEGLEMLSDNCSRQLHSLIANISSDARKKLDNAKESFNVIQNEDSFSEDGDQDFELLIQIELTRLGLAYNPSKLIQVQRKHYLWLNDCVTEQDLGAFKESKELHVNSMQCLAEMTARSVEAMHKLGQLLLIANTKVTNVASPLANLTAVLCAELGILSGKFSKCLNTAADDSENPDDVTPLLTSLFLEANNSANYIREAFHLLYPVVELIIIQQS